MLLRLSNRFSCLMTRFPPKRAAFLNTFCELWALMGVSFTRFFNRFCKCHVFMNVNLYICFFSVDVVISDKKTEVERRL